MAYGKCITCTKRNETLPRQYRYRRTKKVTKTKTIRQMQIKEGEHIQSMIHVVHVSHV